MHFGRGRSPSPYRYKMPQNQVISYPVPPYSNVPIETDFYQPKMFFINDVARGRTTIVTTSVPNDYVVGQEIRLIIPPQSGCRQLNNVTGYVIQIITETEVELDIDSSIGVNPFTPSIGGTQPQILAIGDIRQGQVNTNGLNNQLTSIPGSFINIS